MVEMPGPGDGQTSVGQYVLITLLTVVTEHL